MPVETIGQAFSYDWRVTGRCAAGKQDGMSRHKECVYRAEFDMETLVWTRGKSFPLSRLESRLRCLMCGSRDIVLLFSLPTERPFQRGSASSRYSIVNVKPSICRSGNSSRTNCFGTWLAAHGGLPSAAKV